MRPSEADIRSHSARAPSPVWPNALEVSMARRSMIATCRVPANFDQPVALQAAQGATHRLDGKREIIGNVVAGDRQYHAIRRTARKAFGQVHEERSNLLLRGRAAEDQDEVLQPSGLFEGHLLHFLGDPDIGPDQGFEARARISRHNGAVSDRLGGEGMIAVRSEAEHVT
jgi:hypothetical protein